MTDKKELAVTELLIPRYKVIADFPFNRYYKVGGIITDDGKNAARNKNGSLVFPCNWDEFPYLFKRLEWWEERKAEEMPAYVRVVKNASGFGLSDNCVRSVTEWRMNHNPPRADCFPILINAICLLPATEAEYLAFINNQTPTK